MTFQQHLLGRVAADDVPCGVDALPDVPGLVRRDGLVDYRASLELQAALREDVVCAARGPSLLALEHPPVYTAGRRASRDEYPYDGTDVVPIERGGRLTWHGPGQLVVYIVGRLRNRTDASGLVRGVEAAVIEVLRELGLGVDSVDGRSGAWLPADRRGPARKVAAIGLAIRRGVTSHGVAVNCTNDLRPFGLIVPCGISDAGVGSFADAGLQDVTPAVLAPRLLDGLERRIGERYETVTSPLGRTRVVLA
ncbi:lipoyl(octanoyl) transferase LipB [Pseudoclavibacter chungangensis]|uniref:Octanoyltransferase n=1 Tax=Pseudoclavibacter chungangensis TaxID=587635 RepID=A0A7J5BN39_9MICO|nr:lipoyl(octanoyl) transferase LipB [Pseudoclavibacter chungangensis]KAB1653129.1 lipoyl(octanoyl) transferase LipB [Pseudoclavibacter chungangensis]NYJ66981.1 lipoyl(octanoyl) transferase [Pseudoclavibacter chungangensis]